MSWLGGWYGKYGIYGIRKSLSYMDLHDFYHVYHVYHMGYMEGYIHSSSKLKTTLFTTFCQKWSYICKKKKKKKNWFREYKNISSEGCMRGSIYTIWFMWFIWYFGPKSLGRKDLGIPHIPHIPYGRSSRANRRKSMQHNDLRRRRTLRPFFGPPNPLPHKHLAPLDIRPNSTRFIGYRRTAQVVFSISEFGRIKSWIRA